MPYFLVGLALLVLLMFGARAFVGADPKKLARNVKRYGGFGAMALAVLAMATGRGGLAVPLFVVGSMLLGRGMFAGFPFPGSRNRTAGQASRVRTSMIEMELDHDTGEMEGAVLSGRFEGRKLSSLEAGEVTRLWKEVRRDDGNGAQLLEAYLDRMRPGWRDEAGAAATGGKAGRKSAGPATGPMTVEEAYEVLGLERGAGIDAVRKAHRDLMKKLHPDHGGSTYLAAQINQAKDLLLKTLG
ncbi:MAG: DnaJ domain-containing protein [Pseudomonadota bacterium]|nr:DnaJ domain-containing protein [Pseudomonadota bacterium]